MHENLDAMRRLIVVALLLVTIPCHAGSEETKPQPGDDPLTVAMAYLQSHHPDLGLAEADIADVVVNAQSVSRQTGTHHVYLLQRFEGIEVKNGLLNLAITSDGQVLHVGHRFIADLARKVSGSTELSAVEALHFAAAALELERPTGVRQVQAAEGRNQSSMLSDAGISLEKIPARLVYQPLASGDLRLAWDLEIQALDPSHWWSVRIDAENGRVLDQSNYVVSDSYEVIPLPFESPNHTSMPPPADARMIEVDPFLDSPFSPFGWHDTDGTDGAEFTITRGNNAHAYADTNGDNLPDTGANAEPDGGATLDFTGATVPLDFSLPPATYTQASIANLFYWTNILHDVLAGYGFDEISGNFQVVNYSGDGLGNDDVRAEAQDGAGFCAANFGTPADGQRPRMQMFLCNNVIPARDGSFDHGVVIHEYGHGVSNRLTGGPSQVSCLNNLEQMGEGWSDYLGMILTQEPGDAGSDARGIGTYLFGQGPDGPGIRNAPYSTDFAVNNFTYSDISSVSIPHGVGHVWATLLWQMSWNLIDDYGLNPDIYGDWTTGGNNLALQLVMDGLKLQPCSPGFVDGRDAILTADDILTGTGGFFTGVNQCSIWDAFAIRGLGFSADQGNVNNVNDGVEAFDVPPSCETIGAPIAVQNICQGGSARFRIGVGDQFTSPPVTLSVVGEPAGTTATFIPPMLDTVPGISELEISNTDSATPGTYVLTVNGSDTGPNAFDTQVELNVFDDGPVDGPSLTTPTDGATDLPVVVTFEWQEVADALSYTVEVDDDPGFGSIDYTASGILDLTHTTTIELDFHTEYFWRVRGDNLCGSGMNSAVFRFTTLAFPGDCPEGVEPNVLFTDDLENGAAGWSSSGTGDTWALSSDRFDSPTTSFYAVDPAALSDQRLVSPPVTLMGGGLTLQFSNYQAFETPNGDGRCWDAGILEITTDGGANWQHVPNDKMLTDPYNSIIWNDQPGNNPITSDYGAVDAWCDELQPFTASVVDLDAWAGETVQFRWRLGSDSAVGNEGWYIDDVKVQACGEGEGGLIFEDGFETGDTTGWGNTVSFEDSDSPHP